MSPQSILAWPSRSSRERTEAEEVEMDSGKGSEEWEFGAKSRSWSRRERISK